MSGFTVSIVIELLVAFLLGATIFYCVTLNRRLTRLKADERALKATISELITATQIAERAILGLKQTVRDCDQTLGERLRTAERFMVEIDREVGEGREVLARITRITEAARGGPQAQAEPAPKAKPASGTPASATLAAAQAFAARVSARAA